MRLGNNNRQKSQELHSSAYQDGSDVALLAAYSICWMSLTALGRFFRFLLVRPEVQCGMTIPREAMLLEGEPASPRLVTNRSRTDKTQQILSYSDRRVRELEADDLCGFIFKKDPPFGTLPGQGLRRRRHAEQKRQRTFAAAVARHFPLLPLEGEGRLNAPALPTLPERHRRAANPAHGRDGARLELLQSYEAGFMKDLALHATVGKNCNVLQHIMGYFKKELSREEKEELLKVIDRYRHSLLPPVVPLTLLKHYVAKYRQEYLQQFYLSPHPSELMLRNHV